MNKDRITHIVFVEVVDNDSNSKYKSIEKLKDMLENLPKYISEIVSLEVGRNISDRSNFDLSLTVILNSKEDLNKYRTHPKHVEVLDFMKTLELNTAVVDYLF